MLFVLRFDHVVPSAEYASAVVPAVEMLPAAMSYSLLAARVRTVSTIFPGVPVYTAEPQLVVTSVRFQVEPATGAESAL